MQDYIGVAYTATQSILELFKLEVDYSSTSFQPKLQDCIGVAYTATQSILELFKLEVNYSSTSICFSKSARLHRSCLYSNSFTQLFNWNSISAKVQDYIGVAYTATQSILELFKLEVDYSSTSFQQKCKIA